MSEVIDAPQKTQEQKSEQSKPWLFKPGQSGNPSGRPKGSRSRLQGDFFRELARDFSEHGRSAIEAARLDDPNAYIKTIASLMPKEFALTRPLDEIPDEQLDAAIIAVRAILAAQDSGDGTGSSDAPQSAEALQALRKAG